MERWTKILVLALVAVSAARMTPSTVSNTVYSTDAWPLLRLAELLQSEPEIRVLGINSHHARYPSAVLSSLVYTTVAGVDLYSFYAFMGAPLASLVLAILFYALLRRYFNAASSTLGVLGLLVYPSFALFTSAYLKEVYAYTVTLTLLLLVATGLRTSSWLLIGLASYSLVLSHPLTSLIVIASTSTFLYILFIDYVKRGRPLETREWKVLLAFSTVLGSLYALHARLAGPPVPLDAPDLIVLSIYGFFVYASYFAARGGRGGSRVGAGSVILATLLTLTAISLYVGLLEGPSVGLNAFFYASPLVLLLAGLRVRDERRPPVLGAVLLPLATGVLYTLSYARFAAGIVHRFLNYLAYPIGWCISTASEKKPLLTSVLLLCLLCCSWSAIYAASTGRDPFTYYWRYTPRDLVLKKYVEIHVEMVIAASVKYYYLLGGDRVTYSADLAVILSSCKSGGRPLVFSVEELEYGFPVDPLHYIRPGHDLLTCGGIVYNAGGVYVGVF